jgi:serine/threonine-protein kinase HipA
MSELRVELYGTHVGQLTEQGGSFDFRVVPDGIHRFGLGSSTLSFAVPLLRIRSSKGAPRRRNFFDELLPEGRARARLAGNAMIARDYTVGMLKRYGRDVAGAVKVWDPAAPGEPRTPALRPLTGDDVRALLDDVARSPLGNTTPRRMSSLAGVQDKIVLARSAQGWAEPLDGYASTHIIKPVMGGMPSLIFDEEYGARIARHLGLTHYDTTIETFAGRSALVIERYDRSENEPDRRLHQEDFNQALGYGGDAKYENEGHPGLAAIAALLRQQVSPQSVSQLLRLTTMSVAVGNLDMHAKNISVLHHPDGKHELAPAYDVVPQLHLVEDHEFAFSINGTHAHADITIDDLIEEGLKWRAVDPEKIVRETITSIAEFVSTERPHPGAAGGLDGTIARICAELLQPTRAVRTTTEKMRRGPLREPPVSPGGWGGPVGR